MFTYKANDGSADSNVAVVSISITTLNSPNPSLYSNEYAGVIVNQGAWARWTWQDQTYTTSTLPIIWPQTRRVWLPTVLRK